MMIITHDDLTPRRIARKKIEKMFLAWPSQAHLYAIGEHGVITSSTGEFIIEVRDYPGRKVDAYGPMRADRTRVCLRTIAALEPFAGRSDIVDEVIENARYELDLFNELED
jgi:hypothetical protein